LGYTLILFDSRPGHIREKSRLGKIETRKYVVNYLVDTGVLQANGIQHATGCFVDAMRRIAEPGVTRGSLEDDGTDIRIRVSLDARVFFPEANATGQQHNGRRHRDTA
jgi:hypothetical protein